MTATRAPFLFSIAVVRSIRDVVVGQRAVTAAAVAREKSTSAATVVSPPPPGARRIPLEASPARPSQVGTPRSRGLALAVEDRRPFSTTASRRHTFRRPITTANKWVKVEAETEEEVEERSRLSLHRASRKLPAGLESVLPPSLAKRVSFRSARPEDCADIVKYLQAHAQWEGYPDAIEITEADLIRDGFGERPCFRCDVAEAHGKDDVTCIIGYALYNVTYCAWKGKTLLWENLFIHPHYRALGVGSVFFHKVCKTFSDQGCKVITGYVDMNDVELVRWYESLGFRDVTSGLDFHMYTGIPDADADGSVAEFLRDGPGVSKKAMSHGIVIE